MTFLTPALFWVQRFLENPPARERPRGLDELCVLTTAATQSHSHMLAHDAPEPSRHLPPPPSVVRPAPACASCNQPRDQAIPDQVKALITDDILTVRPEFEAIDDVCRELLSRNPAILCVDARSKPQGDLPEIMDWLKRQRERLLEARREARTQAGLAKPVVFHSWDAEAATVSEPLAEFRRSNPHVDWIWTDDKITDLKTQYQRDMADFLIQMQAPPTVDFGEESPPEGAVDIMELIPEPYREAWGARREELADDESHS